MENPRKPLLHLFPTDGGPPLNLELPLPVQGHQYNRIFVSDSLPSTASKYPEGTKVLEPEFISTGQLDVILVHVKMHGAIKREGDNAELFNVFISRDRLIHIYEKYMPNSQGLPVPWSEWGPAASRWIPKSWLCPTDWALHGSRYVSYAWSWSKFMAQIKGQNPTPDRGDNVDDNAIVLLDFNPYLVHKGPKIDDHLRVVHYGEYNEDTDMFDEPLGNLGFRVAMMPIFQFCQAQFDTRNGNLLIFDVRVASYRSFAG